MAVRLRVAGIYYDEKFDIKDLAPNPAFRIPGRVPPKDGGVTIFELLEAARRKPGRNKENFVYVFERRDTFLSITSLGVTHKKGLVGSLGGKARPAGTYQLTEIDIPAGVVAWQYYVYRKGISESQLQPPMRDAAGNPTDPSKLTGFSPAKGKSGSGFTGFDQIEIADGDEVIWRQIAILRGPNIPPQ